MVTKNIRSTRPRPDDVVTSQNYQQVEAVHLHSTDERIEAICQELNVVYGEFNMDESLPFIMVGAPAFIALKPGNVAVLQAEQLKAAKDLFEESPNKFMILSISLTEEERLHAALYSDWHVLGYLLLRADGSVKSHLSIFAMTLSQADQEAVGKQLDESAALIKVRTDQLRRKGGKT